MKRTVRFLALGLAALVAAALVLDRVSPFPLGALRPRPAAMVLDSRDKPLRLFLPPDQQWRLPVRLDEVPPRLVQVLLASEDRYFRSHPGVNPAAVLRAAWTNLRAGRVVSGGSTIPMQLARLAEPRPRTLAAKALEALRAIQLTAHLAKDEILELYLNNAPFGRNIVGLGAAGWFYFGKRPADLSLGEMALLTALPRAPTSYDPVRQPEAATRVRDRVLDQVARLGVVPAEEAERAKRLPLPRAMQRAPLRAPHFAEAVLARYGFRPRLATTLDPAVQAVAEKAIAGRLLELRSLDIENAAALVLDLASGEVRAWAGSADYADQAHHGPIDAVRILRSPGSALKPFLYALAMDRGIIAPGTPLLDIPSDFAGYRPENYDQVFHGQVTAAEALIRSLNVPAVRLLAQVGVQPLHDLLRRGGLATLDKPADHYGLALALGACEVTLLDLTTLYAALARGGTWLPARLLRGEPAESVRLFSPEASRLVSEVLGQLTRPELAQSWEFTRDAPPVAWKSGTSFGQRDAWAVGFSRNFVVGVWVGNLDGHAVKGLAGAAHAAPILFDILRVVDAGAHSLPRYPAGLDSVEVCALSGGLPGPYCTERARIRVIPGTTRLAPCPMHRQVFVDAKTGLRLAGPCLALARPIPRVVADLPPELAAWLRSEGRSPAGEPPLDPRCGCAAEELGPQIVSPSAQTPYVLRRGVPAEYQQIALRAQAGGSVAELFWYQDGRLVARGHPGERLFLTPSPGSHRLVVLDDQGRTSALDFIVQAPRQRGPASP